MLILVALCLSLLCRSVSVMPLSSSDIDALVAVAVSNLSSSLTIPPSPSLFPHFAARIDQVISSAWKDTTLAGYQDGVDRFLAFCARNGIHSSLCLPANEFLLCSFAAFESGSRSGGAIANDMSGIRAWHIMNNSPYQGSIRLSYVIRGARRNTPASSKRPPRPPVTIPMLDLLHLHLDPSSHLDVACLAVSDCALWGQARLGEFLPLSQKAFSPRYLPTPLNLRPTSSTGLSRMLFLPWSKTAREKGEDLFLGKQSGLSDPIASLDLHLRLNAPLPSSHLFAYRDASGSLVPLTKRKFLARCNSVWSLHGLPSISGHSFRIGGTTELLLRGVPPHIVKALGRWSSDAFLRYWRCLEELAPLHAELLGPRVSSI